MTIHEVHQRFNLELEKYGIKDPVMSTIMEDYINYAYQDYITEMYDSLINPAISFEINERISRILAPLLVDRIETVFVALTTHSADGYTTTIGGTYSLQYIVSESAVINTIDCDGDAITNSVNIIPIKHNMIKANKNNPFLCPTNEEIWRVNTSGGRIELILASGDTPVSYTCRFIKKHTPYSIYPTAPATGEMEIDSSVHGDIAARAAYMYLSDQRSNNIKTKANVQ
jgi:hypothetical protein